MACPRAPRLQLLLPAREYITAFTSRITLETAERLYVMSRGDLAVVQGLEKGIALLQSALDLLSVGHDPRVGASWCGLAHPALAPQLWAW